MGRSVARLLVGTTWLTGAEATRVYAWEVTGWLGYHGGYRWYVLGGGDRAAGDCVVVLDRRAEMRCG